MDKSEQKSRFSNSGCEPLDEIDDPVTAAPPASADDVDEDDVDEDDDDDDEEEDDIASMHIRVSGRGSCGVSHAVLKTASHKCEILNSLHVWLKSNQSSRG